MQKAQCSVCQTLTPLGQSFSVAEKVFCQSCLEQHLADNDDHGLTEADIKRCTDPTICVQCEADNGDQPFETIAELPVCPSCADFFRNRPFPAWLKIASFGFLCVTVLAFSHNWRFFMGYIEALRGNRAFAEERFEEGMALYISAGERVPEVPELLYYCNFFKAQRLFMDEPDEALGMLQEVRQFVPNEEQQRFDYLILLAEMSLAFDEHDYGLLLEKSRRLEQMAPNDSTTAASVASALACMYAETGEPHFQDESLEKLAQARQMIGDSEDSYFKEYENRIQHRLDSRVIISRSEFLERFPDGWKQMENE